MDKLAAVREKFILSLQDKADELEALLEEARATEVSERLRSLVHKIAGSAGFYEQVDVAAAAADIDGKLKSLTDEVLSEALKEDIGALIKLMRNCDKQA